MKEGEEGEREEITRFRGKHGGLVVFSLLVVREGVGCGLVGDNELLAVKRAGSSFNYHLKAHIS